MLARRGKELTKTIARTQEEGRTADEDPTVEPIGQGGELLYEGVPFWMTNTDRTILNMTSGR